MKNINQACIIFSALIAMLSSTNYTYKHLIECQVQVQPFIGTTVVNENVLTLKACYCSMPRDNAYDTHHIVHLKIGQPLYSIVDLEAVQETGFICLSLSNIYPFPNKTRCRPHSCSLHSPDLLTIPCQISEVSSKCISGIRILLCIF